MLWVTQPKVFDSSKRTQTRKFGLKVGHNWSLGTKKTAPFCYLVDVWTAIKKPFSSFRNGFNPVIEKKVGANAGDIFSLLSVDFQWTKWHWKVGHNRNRNRRSADNFDRVVKVRLTRRRMQSSFLWHQFWLNLELMETWNTWRKMQVVLKSRCVMHDGVQWRRDVAPVAGAVLSAPDLLFFASHLFINSWFLFLHFFSFIFNGMEFLNIVFTHWFIRRVGKMQGNW